MRLLLLIVIGSALASGPTSAAKRQFTPADRTQYALYDSASTGTVTGQAFGLTKGGDVRIMAGRPVCLDPATDFAGEWLAGIAHPGFWGSMVKGLADNNDLEDPRLRIGPPASDYRRTETADAQGNFEFDSLPTRAEGLPYILWTLVDWKIVGDAGLKKTGGFTYRIVWVKPGKTTKAMLTPVAKDAPLVVQPKP